jgi:hypothetical protein
MIVNHHYLCHCSSSNSMRGVSLEAWQAKLLVYAHAGFSFGPVLIVSPAVASNPHSQQIRP